MIEQSNVVEDTIEDDVAKENNLKRRHLLGLCLVIAVVIIWVSSSILIQIIFLDASFDKPFFLTYFSTSLFSLYLFGFAFQWKQWSSNLGFPSKKYSHLINDSEEDLVINGHSPKSKPQKLSVVEVLKLSAIFCPIWFIANYTYNAGLALTSVSSNTILSTLSGLFALLMSVFLKVDTFNIWKLIAALITIGGVSFVSFSDTGTGGRNTLLGDLLTMIGAFVYAFYCTLLKKKIDNESRLHMPMFFGFLGLMNFLMLWPFFGILHWLNVEKFELPHGRVILYLTVNGLIGTVLSDILEAWSIILTTPLVNTLGLSLTIPFAMISDKVRQNESFSFMYVVGSILVIVGFLLANLSSAAFEKQFNQWKSALVSQVREKFRSRGK